LAAVAEKNRELVQAIDLAHRILRDDPFREDIHCLIMRAQAALGNRVAVREQYEALRVLLHKELGVEPATQTQKTYHDLLSQKRSPRHKAPSKTQNKIASLSQQMRRILSIKSVSCPSSLFELRLFLVLNKPLSLPRLWPWLVT